MAVKSTGKWSRNHAKQRMGEFSSSSPVPVTDLASGDDSGDGGTDLRHGSSSFV